MAQNLHLDAFCQFWFDNFNSPIPPLPSKPSDLSITQLELLRLYDGGKLYQNLFSTKPDSGKLPADLENNIRKGLVGPSIRICTGSMGTNFRLQEIERAKLNLKIQKIESEIEASGRNVSEAERKAARSKYVLWRRWLEPLSQGQIIKIQ